MFTIQNAVFECSFVGYPWQNILQFWFYLAWINHSTFSGATSYNVLLSIFSVSLQWTEVKWNHFPFVLMKNLWQIVFCAEWIHLFIQKAVHHWHNHTHMYYLCACSEPRFIIPQDQFHLEKYLFAIVFQPYSVDVIFIISPTKVYWSINAILRSLFSIYDNNRRTPHQ